MGFSESSSHLCKKHPNHHEKQGVCPSCLRERLSRLCSASYKEANSRVAASFSPSWSFSPADDPSASSSNSASPAARRHRNSHKRNDGSGLMMGTMGSSAFMVKVGANDLKKSRSLAFVPRNFDDDEVKNGKKKKGFWSKLLRFKGKNKDVLMHSSSMRFMIGRVN